MQSPQSDEFSRPRELPKMLPCMFPECRLQSFLPWPPHLLPCSHLYSAAPQEAVDPLRTANFIGSCTCYAQPIPSGGSFIFPEPYLHGLCPNFLQDSICKYHVVNLTRFYLRLRYKGMGVKYGEEFKTCS